MTGQAVQSSAVLVCGGDEILLRCRGRVLERSGFDIATASTPAQAAEWLGAKQFGLVVLCHTLSHATRQALHLLCWRSRLPIYEVPVLMAPDELVQAVAARTMERRASPRS